MLSTLTAANMPLNTLHTVPQFSESTGNSFSKLQQAAPHHRTPQLCNKERRNFGLKQVNISRTSTA